MAQPVKHLKTSLETADDDEEDIIEQPQMYAKDSFDRFGDDLCGVVLSYLSLKQRFRLQVVSKQLRRTLFDSVVDIDINDGLFQHKDNTETDIVRALKAIATKCPNIETIDCRGFGFNDGNKFLLKMFHTIGDHFPNFRYFRFDWYENSRQRIETMKYWIPMISSSHHSQQSLLYCHRLSHLTVHHLSHAFDAFSPEILPKRLMSFGFAYRRSDDYKLMSHLDYKSIELISFGDYNPIANQSFAQFVHQLSQLTQLRHLGLELWLRGNSLTDFLDTIGVNGKHVNELTFVFNTYSEQKVRALDSLQNFPQLKRIILFLSGDIDWKLMDSLRKFCRRLTHLSLYLEEVNNNLLFCCDKEWPRIHSLFIQHKNNAVVVDTLEHISRLRDLQTLVMDGNGSNGLNDNDFEDLLTKSPKLKNIEMRVNNVSMFYSRKNVTNV